ncbi:alpha-amylase family protein [Protaetiibacter sp. SSC-01]|uniref:alpha-amylase family protein n=1 Tax=Protaetiibacter sp. SSC-01 TaxID=2759943 RepID=UPI0016574F0B|nr:alpha-amylase family protein [Protaetiibacter sp. SSC-01]QNO38210.1 alpha-amylase family protein [Protaetiibacter sp. SSC-01]
MKITDTSDLWWKTAVVYCLDVETYMDWNGDGCGDFEGLAHRIDHLADLGVTCLWLMPFYPTPGRDDGYDITDYLAVDPRIGDLGRFVEFVRMAKDRGMRVIIDLVVNHTSDKHPWFREARRSRDSAYHDYYVWVDEKPKSEPANVFPGEETSVWEYEEKVDRYYLHSFYRHQPDLNIGNPRVRDELARVMGFWLELGVSGFRVDAVPFFLAGVGGDPHQHLRDLRRFLQRRASDAVLLGEVNLTYDEQLKFFGGGDGASQLTMQFDFMGMQSLYLSLARHDATPLAEMLATRPALPVETQWANFVRNHDELTLDKLSDEEREEVFEAFAPEERMRVYGRGIVRRLPTMLDGDPRRIRMVYSLMFSLPGTPVLFYGEEIGMAENLDIEGRKSVRTPMQWSSEKNGGFSSAPRSRLCSAPPEGGYAPEHVNVISQRHDPDSLLAHIRLLITRYRSSSEIGWGELELLEHDVPSVLAHSVRSDTGRMIALHNLAPEAATVSITVKGEPDDSVLSDLLREGTTPLGARGRVEVELEPYGYRWMRVLRPGDRRLS